MDTDSDSDFTNGPQLWGDFEEGEVSDHDQEPTPAILDQALLEEQAYRVTVRGKLVFYGLYTNPG